MILLKRIQLESTFLASVAARQLFDELHVLVPVLALLATFVELDQHALSLLIILI